MPLFLAEPVRQKPFSSLEKMEFLFYFVPVFRPCIDLHQGKVKQIVGSSLRPDGTAETNYVSPRPAVWYARLYREDGLRGGHIIMLGPGNEEEARSALAEYPGGLQIGGGITPENAQDWLAAGASHVIVTSYLFDEEGRFSWERLERIASVVGPDRLVIDLSCRRVGEAYYVAARRWQQLTSLRLTPQLFQQLQPYCAEFLIHAVDIEGKQQGLDLQLVAFLADHSPLPTTYAGGARSLQDLEDVTRIGRGRIDLTIGSALDIFGGTGVRYRDCVAFNRRLQQQKPSFS